MRRFLVGVCLLLPLGLRAAPGFEDSMAQRLLACTACHGAQGRAGPDGYYPRLAGKPVGYLYQQLRHFRNGQRHYAPMVSLLEPLSDAYLYAIAEHFAAQDVPYPPPTSPAPYGARAARGKQLATEGDEQQKIPACARCHGQALMGVQPYVPALLGLPRHYLNAQLGAWRTGSRHSHAPDCMADVAQSLGAEDLAAVVDWLAAQPVAAGAKPALTLPEPMPRKCGATAPGALPVGPQPTPAAQSAQAASGPRGQMLARQGNCIHCHTAPGGATLAGGRRIDTPFGSVYSGNLTPDAQTGLGRWSRDDFWQALHHGRSRDGRYLSPAFPYTNFTWVSREDSDALFDWLQSLAPVQRAPTANTLRWPFGTATALGVWRSLYFKPETFLANAAKSAQWNRGAYLARGLGHCDACHAERNALGGVERPQALGGGLVQALNWYAPSLADPRDGGLQSLTHESAVQLLKAGVTAGHQASGPMAEVVQHSLQYWSEADLSALATYLRDLPAPPVGPPAARRTAATADSATAGASVYRKHCAQCHGEKGEGVPKAYVALAGNRAVNATQAVNLVQTVLRGGFAPATTGNPRPFGMPPFAQILSDADIAAVLSYVRMAWGNSGAEVSAPEVDRLRRQVR